MEWLDGPENMNVDIGYMPEMSLAITGPSEVARGNPKQHQVRARSSGVDQMKWTHEISEEEAVRNLELKFYPFKQVRIS